MIRPLEYCENIEHLTSSIETIDARILELVNLRSKYYTEKQRVVSSNETELVNLKTGKKETTDKEYLHEQ